MCLVLCFRLAEENCELMREIHANIICNSGLLLLSVADFGSPALVTTAISVERPVAGVWKLATSVAYGEPEEGESGTQESQGKSSRSHASDDVV